MMDNLAFKYQAILNLKNAQFLRIEHGCGLVAVVYKIIQPNAAQLVLKVCPNAQDYFREVYFLKMFKGKLPVPHVLQIETLLN